jgi:mannose-6-phosphate isomerase-like protein (cupin superfamily)
LEDWVELVDARTYRATRPWGARDITSLVDASVRLHWTNEAYHWHVNSDTEVFVVIDGRVDMHVREGGTEKVVPLASGAILRVDPGDEHYAQPIGEARILVIERRGSE